jgi:hypothetical protein
MVVMQEIRHLLPKILQHVMIVDIIRRSALEPERVLQGGKSALVVAAANEQIDHLSRVLCPPPDA